MVRVISYSDYRDKSPNSKIGHKMVYHAQGLSQFISAEHGLGASEGIVIISDDRKQISIWHDQKMSALVPSIHYVAMNGKQYFLRLQYPAQEIDETFIKNREEQKLERCWKINLQQDG